MKMLLQHAGTGLYVQSKGKWTDNPRLARGFEEWIDAYDYTIFNCLTDTFIVPLAVEYSLVPPPIAQQHQVSELDLK